MIIERMTVELGLTPQFVKNLAITASYEYKKFTVKKKNGGDRDIFHPSRKLKSVQIWMLRKILEQFPVHEAATAYRPGLSIYDNATRHASGRYLLRLDLEKFFPSIKISDFSKFIENNPDTFENWTAEDKRCTSLLMFRSGELTIGAPTSPALSNILCFQLDVEVSKMARHHGLMYTRYADDLFFSSIKPNVLASVTEEVKIILDQITIPAALKINQNKTWHSSKKGRRRVTGVTLGSDGKPHIPRSYKRIIRSMVHKYEQLNEMQKVALPGMISFVAGEEPEFVNSLITKYGFERISQVTKVLSLAERQRIHVPKVKLSSLKIPRARSAHEQLREILKRAGYDLGTD